MRSKRKWLALFWLAIILSACTPAETLPGGSLESDDTMATPEQSVESTETTSRQVEPTETQMRDPAPSQTRLDLVLDPDEPIKATPVQEIIPMPVGVTPVSPPDPVAQELVDRAMNDLTQRKGIALEEIKLDYFAYVAWPNTSLGCPEPGMFYADMLVDGYQILLRVGLQVYSYHGATSGDGPALCEGIGQKLDVPPPLPSLDQ